MTHDSVDHLNAEAIYAGMRWFRGFAESEAGKRFLARAMADVREEADVRQEAEEGVTSSAAGTLTLIICPGFKPDRNLVAQLYPGEEDSVRIGIVAARFYLWGPRALRQIIHSHAKGQLGVAIRRFIQDQTPTTTECSAVQRSDDLDRPQGARPECFFGDDTEPQKA